MNNIHYPSEFYTKWLKKFNIMPILTKVYDDTRILNTDNR